MPDTILRLDDLPIPHLGVWYPDHLFYYSLLNRAWVRVLRIDITGQCIVMDIDPPGGGKSTLFPHRIYKNELEFKMEEAHDAE